MVSPKGGLFLDLLRRVRPVSVGGPPKHTGNQWLKCGESMNRNPTEPQTALPTNVGAHFMGAKVKSLTTFLGKVGFDHHRVTEHLLGRIG